LKVFLPLNKFKLSELSWLRDRLFEYYRLLDKSYSKENNRDFPQISNLLHSIDDRGIYEHGFQTPSVKIIEDELENLSKHILECINYLINLIKKNEVFYYKPKYIFDDKGYEYTELSNFEWENSFKKENVSEELKNDVIGQIYKYSHYSYPALEIGPGTGDWTEYLVASDPLYLIDYHKEAFDHISKKFSETYCRRLRFYSNNHNKFDFSMLPLEQFNLIFSWNVFDYYTLESLNKLLPECFSLLRPGGHMIFSYNNCDYTANIAYVERGVRSWMTSKLLTDTSQSIGFEFIENRIVGTQHYCILKKPGTLSTIKLQQALGSIIRKNS